MTYTAIIHAAEEGGYWGEVPELPGCFSQGETLEQTRDNLREAIVRCLNDDGGDATMTVA